MNERIKELAEQAGFNPYNYQGSNLALFEKFAELIVRECAKVAEQWYSDYPKDDRLVSECIMETFGVEE